MAAIMCKCMHSATESIYHQYTDDFTSIIQRSIVLWDYYVSMQYTEITGPTIDMGWIPPLYYTALKCRIPRVRAHAIRLLRSVPHKEGVWDSTLAADVSERVKQLKEQQTDSSVTMEDDFALDGVRCLSEWDQYSIISDEHKFYEVQADLSEINGVIIHGRKWSGNSTKTHRFDGHHWHEIGLPNVS